MADGTSLPQPGDLIEIDGTLHQHWALYMGDGYVINLLPVDKLEIKLEGLKVIVFIRTVKKELLMELVGNYTWRVNNKSDQDHSPLPVEKIISRAEAYIGKEVTYLSFGSNCERFVKKLRYGAAVSEQWRAFVGGEMHILDKRGDEEFPKPGDLIEIKQGHYDHWALYVGDGYVIHVTPVDEEAPSLSDSSDTRRMRKAKVKKELLREVAGNDAWAVNNKYDCHCTPLPEEEIIQGAEGFIGEEMACDVFDFKADDFAKKLRYGDQWRAFVGGEMHILDTRGDEEYPKPGDLIEIKQGHYDHWALYVGRGYIIHVAPVDEEAPSLSGSSGTRLMRKAKVKKELLREVARNKKWSVSNEYDSHILPLPVEEIIWHAEDCVGKELTYNVFKSKSVDFLSKLRHVGLLRAFEGGEIHHQDPINRKYLPIPGDLIEIKWIPYLAPYQHWALYMGHGCVIHVTGVDGIALSSASVSSSHGEAMVKKELLKDVVKNRWWCVNNKYDKYRKPFPVEEIIRRAEHIYNQINNTVPYRLLYKNCEHFVTKLRYGEAFSDQVLTRLQFTNIAATAGGVAGLISLSSMPGVPLLAIAGAGGFLCYCSASSVIEHYSICAKFRKPGRDILEQRCC